VARFRATRALAQRMEEESWCVQKLLMLAEIPMWSLRNPYPLIGSLVALDEEEASGAIGVTWMVRYGEGVMRARR
jgi:hypothetical protein